jgi:hypothetical protein
MRTSQVVVYDFLAQRSLAIVGVSRSGKKFGNTIYKTLKERGYRLYPVHPQAETVEGDPCYRSLGVLPEKVGGVVVCVPPYQTEQVVHDAFAAGIERVWMQQGAESYAAIRYCEKNGISAVHGHCILMFAEPVASFHRVHRWVWKLFGKYPAADSAAAPQSPSR